MYTSSQTKRSLLTIIFCLEILMFPIKAVQIKGNLGRWNIAVTTVCFDCKENINFFCTISSNFCVNTKFNEVGDIVTYQQPLLTSLMNTKKDGKLILRSNPTWFEINRFSDVLFLNLQDDITGQEIKANIDAIITIMFKRIS